MATADLHRETGHNRRQIEEWSRKYRWVDRVMLFEQYVQERTSQTWRDRMQKRYEQLFAIQSVALNEVAQALVGMDKLSKPDALRSVEALTRATEKLAEAVGIAPQQPVVVQQSVQLTFNQGNTEEEKRQRLQDLIRGGAEILRWRIESHDDGHDGDEQERQERLAAPPARPLLPAPRST